MRLLVAIAVWAGALLAVHGLTQVVSGYADQKPAGATATPTPPHEVTDLSRELPPRPPRTIAADSRASLLRRANLERVLKAVTERFGPGEDVVAFALYPGEADFVMAEGGEVFPVRAPISRVLDVGDRQGFAGNRQAVTLQQLQPAGLARTLRVVTKRLALRDLDRVVLDTDSFGAGLAGYRIEPREGLTTFKALLTGGEVDEVGPGGTRQIR